jgi:hypothetical protein
MEPSSTLKCVSQFYRLSIAYRNTSPPTSTHTVVNPQESTRNIVGCHRRPYSICASTYTLRLSQKSLRIWFARYEKDHRTQNILVFPLTTKPLQALSHHTHTKGPMGPSPEFPPNLYILAPAFPNAKLHNCGPQKFGRRLEA